LEQILRGTPVKLFGAGKPGLAQITFRQQMRSFVLKLVLKQSRLNEMIIMPLDVLKLDLNCSTSPSGMRHYFQNSSQFLPL
jgi:hypothetical protein